MGKIYRIHLSKGNFPIIPLVPKIIHTKNLKKKKKWTKEINTPTPFFTYLL